MTCEDIGYEKALALTLERLSPLPSTNVPVWDAVGMVTASDVTACVDSPSLTSSTKDGFAVRFADLANASDDRPRRLRLSGQVFAGQSEDVPVQAGCTVKVMTGAPLPTGADAVVPSEAVREEGDRIVFGLRARSGWNVLRRGTDVSTGQVVAPAGTLIHPAMTGLLAAGGRSEVPVHRRPEVMVVATGDEVVAPGKPLTPGQLYASNLVTLRSWLRRFGVESRHAVVSDEPDELKRVLEASLRDSDVVLTSGGAWKSARDFTPIVLAEMGADLVYQRVRLAPGKAVTLGLIDDKVVFCLPGGPPSNEMAFLQLALPGILRLWGRTGTPFRSTRAKVTTGVVGGHGDPTWTSFFQARLNETNGGLQAEPLQRHSRLVCQAQAEALIKVPEKKVRFEPGEEAEVQVLFERPLLSERA